MECDDESLEVEVGSEEALERSTDGPPFNPSWMVLEVSKESCLFVRFCGSAAWAIGCIVNAFPCFLEQWS